MTSASFSRSKFNLQMVFFSPKNERLLQPIDGYSSALDGFITDRFKSCLVFGAFGSFFKVVGLYVRNLLNQWSEFFKHII